TDRNYNYFYKKFKLETNYTRYIDSIRYKIDLHDKKEKHNEHLKKKLDYFTNYYLLLSLNMYRVLKYQDYTDRFEFNEKLYDSIIDYLIQRLNENYGTENASYVNNTTVKVHLYEIMLMNNKSGGESLVNDLYYKKLKEILKTETAVLSHDLRFSLYNILIQHCANRIQRGFSEYRNERWELDKIALSQGIYMSIVESDFPPPAFASIVRDASEVKEFEWAESFIEEFKAKVEPTNFETVFNLSLALIHFNKNNFQSSLDYLNKIKPVKRWEFKFAVKELTLQVFYELSTYSQAYYLLDSYRHFVSSMVKNFSTERIESRNNFIKYYSKMIKTKERDRKNDLRDIKTDLENNQLIIFNRQWLIEKMNELEN